MQNANIDAPYAFIPSDTTNEADMRMRHAAAILGAMMMVQGADAFPLGVHLRRDRVLVVSAPSGDRVAGEQRRIFRSAAAGMAERQIVLVEALDDRERFRQDPVGGFGGWPPLPS